MIEQPGSKPLFTVSKVTCETAQERLIYLRCVLHRKWREIQSDEFSTIPIGTLYKIMRTGKVPRKWWKFLKIKAVRQPRISISKVDMKKASKSIANNITTINIVELVFHLNNYLYEQRIKL